VSVAAGEPKKRQGTAAVQNASVTRVWSGTLFSHAKVQQKRLFARNVPAGARGVTSQEHVIVRDRPRPDPVPKCGYAEPTPFRSDLQDPF